MKHLSPLMWYHPCGYLLGVTWRTQKYVTWYRMTYHPNTRCYSMESENKMVVSYFLVFIDRSLSTDNYIYKALQLVGLPYLQGLIQLFFHYYTVLVKKNKITLCLHRLFVPHRPIYWVSNLSRRQSVPL